MPRHVKSKATLGPKAVKHGRPKGGGWHKLHRVSVDTAALVQVSELHLAWVGPDAKPTDGWLPTCSNMFKTHGAIVKLMPPPGTPESHVRSMERSFYEAGAKSVKVMPTQEEVVVSIDDMEFHRPDMTDTRSLRQVAMERADRATNSHDHDALKALVADAMDHAEAEA